MTQHTPEDRSYFYALASQAGLPVVDLEPTHARQMDESVSGRTRPADQLSAEAETAAQLETMAPSPPHDVVVSVELQRLITQELAARNCVYFFPISAAIVQCIVEPVGDERDGWAQGFGANPLQALHDAVHPQPAPVTTHNDNESR